MNYITESKLSMLSPTGRSRMWDANADGYARGVSSSCRPNNDNELHQKSSTALCSIADIEFYSWLLGRRVLCCPQDSKPSAA